MRDEELEESTIQFYWAFAKCSGNVLLEDAVTRYLFYCNIIKKPTTVFDFAQSIMMPMVREVYLKNREKDILEGLDLSCLRGITGIAKIIATLAFCVDDIRLHFRMNIINDSCHEYKEATSEFVEAIGSVEGKLFQDHLVEFMVRIFSHSLLWLDTGEGESNIIVETLTKLLYDNETSVLVTTKSDKVWSWEPIYNGGDPLVGVVYDLKDDKNNFYQGLVTRLTRLDMNYVLHVHFIGWSRRWDEVWTLNESVGKIFTRETYTKTPYKSYPRHFCDNTYDLFSISSSEESCYSTPRSSRGSVLV